MKTVRNAGIVLAAAMLFGCQTPHSASSVSPAAKFLAALPGEWQIYTGGQPDPALPSSTLTLTRSKECTSVVGCLVPVREGAKARPDRWRILVIFDLGVAPDGLVRYDVTYDRLSSWGNSGLTTWIGSITNTQIVWTSAVKKGEPSHSWTQDVSRIEVGCVLGSGARWIKRKD